MKLVSQNVNLTVPPVRRFHVGTNPHGRVAFLPYLPVTLKGLKPKDPDFEPRTLGEHVRKRRLELNLSRRQAADRFGVSCLTVLNWEKGNTRPSAESIAAIIGFLGYTPFPKPQALGERMLAKRRVMGWTIKEAARQLGVDESTWREWERTGRIPWKRHRVLMEGFLLELDS